MGAQITLRLSGKRVHMRVLALDRKREGQLDFLVEQPRLGDQGVHERPEALRVHPRQICLEAAETLLQRRQV
ncbi:MAG: hypothetical protein CO113_18465 [Elusimicrobia bacterium CG_4_9_14_3_um_filter_62_55]|nr:MAG: hypothetical protein COR54_04485 [Elusimicrobia bacterium CG22_combo_CG10-13_8_21_14_all_63_91]PJA18283.1 MAG: hypothetical protein COX66_01625 [Elusimicrobia bacterium CG_4_10_14_0_2_um_filter_63_34]PJB23424.1 MAG: hypothetical protein CO113_18465 [Elusimicrobia bacterium CG_4_9_14_3_um_filter_62_55]